MNLEDAGALPGTASSDSARESVFRVKERERAVCVVDRAHWAGGEPAGTWPQPPPPPGVLVPAARSTVPRESRRGGLSVHRAEDTPDALPREVL